MQQEINVTIGSGTFVSVLTIILVIAKIMGRLSWSWLWVFSPIWISAVVIAVMFIVVALTCIACDLFLKFKKRRW